MALYIVGSVNADVALPVARLPIAGSTILAGEPVRSGGGKGANVAVAAARDHADVRLVAAVGDDDEGGRSLADLRAEGVDSDGVTVLEGRATGLAMICIDEDGENFVVVAPGANAELTPEMVATGVQSLGSEDVCVFNFEIPDEAVRAGLRIAADRGARVLVNASPVRALPDELFAAGAMIVVNQGELGALTGIVDIGPAASSLVDAGCSAAIVTLGDQGVHVVSAAGEPTHVRAFPVAAPLDTTGAGDAFTGVMAAALAIGADLVDAVRRGAAAGAIATEAIGARAAMPDRAAIDSRLASSSELADDSPSASP